MDAHASRYIAQHDGGSETLRRWRRRGLTIPAAFAAWALVTACSPAALLVALVVDGLRWQRSRRLTTVRMVVFLQVFVTIECVGLLLLFGVWLSSLGDPARRARYTWPVQRWYARASFWVVARLFSLRVIVEGDEQVGRGPLVVFIRHASMLDVLLPGVFLASAHRLRLRYVLKRELLVMPCLDVAGHWLPNHFVARDGRDTERELSAIRSLAEGLGERDGVLIYPEGTRFSPVARERALQRLASDPDALARASALRHLLPCRAGGPTTLLDAARGADVLFVAHSGLEGLTGLSDIWRGTMVGRTLRIRFSRVAAANRPQERVASMVWLADAWSDMDTWLDSHTG